MEREVVEERMIASPQFTSQYLTIGVFDGIHCSGYDEVLSKQMYTNIHTIKVTGKRRMFVVSP
jgi:FAD synthase